MAIAAPVRPAVRFEAAAPAIELEDDEPQLLLGYACEEGYELC